MKKLVPLPPYLPDQPANTASLRRAENVYPLIDGYRPVGSFESTSDPLDESFLGGVSAIASDGSAYLLVGTATDLYRLSSGEWDSLVTGLTAGRWRFAQFGDFVVGVNGSDTREVDLNAGTDSALTGAPTGTSIAVVGDFVVIGQADGDILKVQWSAFNDHTEWTPGTDQSGFQPMLTGGEVMGIGGGEYGVILQRQRLVRMERTGDGTDPFSFSEITPNIGCASKGSVTQAGRSIFFLSDRGFMALEDGAAVKPIGNEKVDRTFQSLVSRDDYERIYAAVDPQNTIAMWVVPGAPGTAWVYNWVLDRWTVIVTPLQGLFAGFTSSLTLEDVSALYPNIDTMPYSLDDPRFSGGAPRLYFVNGAGELGTLSGTPMAAILETSFFELADGDRARVREVEPIGDMADGITLTMDMRTRLGDTARTTTAGELRTSGAMPIRCSGQFTAMTWTIAEGTNWSYFQGSRVAYEPGGGR